MRRVLQTSPNVIRRNVGEYAKVGDIVIPSKGNFIFGDSGDWKIVKKDPTDGPALNYTLQHVAGTQSNINIKFNNGQWDLKNPPPEQQQAKEKEKEKPKPSPPVTPYPAVKDGDQVTQQQLNSIINLPMIGGLSVNGTWHIGSTEGWMLKHWGRAVCYFDLTDGKSFLHVYYNADGDLEIVEKGKTPKGY